MPALSIVIPTRNSDRTLAQCLEAIRRSSFLDYELIVVDGDSTDTTRDIAEKLADRVILQVPNRGRSHARNLGVEASRGDILVFTDSDNVLRPDTLEKIVVWFAGHEETEAVTGLISKEHPHQDFFSQYKNLYMNYIFGRLPERVTFLHGSIYAVRRRALTPGDPSFTTDDTERGQHLFSSGKRIDFLRDLEVVHLKKYGFRSLLRNDFDIPFEWAKIFVKYQGWKQLGRNRTGFAHSPREQLLSILLMPLLLATGALAAPIRMLLPSFVLLGLAWTLLNVHFIAFLSKERGLGFGLRAFFMTFLDHLVMAAGISCGMAAAILGAVFRRRPHPAAPEDVKAAGEGRSP